MANPVRSGTITISDPQLRPNPLPICSLEQPCPRPGSPRLYASWKNVLLNRSMIAMYVLALMGCTSNLPYSIAIGDPPESQETIGREECVLRLDHVAHEIAAQYHNSSMTVRKLQRDFEMRLHERIAGEKEGLINCTDKDGKRIAGKLTEQSGYQPIETVSKKWMATYAVDSTDPDQELERFREYLQSAQLVQDLSKQRLLPDQNDHDTYYSVEHVKARQSQWCGNFSRRQEKPLRRLLPGFLQIGPMDSVPQPTQTMADQDDPEAASPCFKARSLYHVESVLLVDNRKELTLYEYLLKDTHELEGADVPRNRRYVVLGYQIPWDKDRTLVRYGVSFYFKQPISEDRIKGDRAELLGYDLVYANEASPCPNANLDESCTEEHPDETDWSLNNTIRHITGYPFSLMIGVKNAAFEVVKLPFSFSAGMLFGRDQWMYPIENFQTAYNALYVETMTQTHRGAEWGPYRLLLELPLVGQVFQYNYGIDRSEPDCPPSRLDLCSNGARSADGREIASKIFLSRGIYGGDKWGQDTGLWALFTKHSYPDYEVYSPPYRHGTVIDVVWSMFNLSHGPSYSEARYIMDHATRKDRVYLAGHSGGVQRSAAASRILSLHGYQVKKIIGIAGPSIGQAIVDSRYPEAFKIYLNTESGANQDVVSKVAIVAGGFSTFLDYLVIVPLKYVVGGLAFSKRDSVYQFADRLGSSNATIIPVHRKPSSRHETPLRLSLTDRLVFDAYLRSEFASAFNDQLERPDDPHETDRPHAFPWDR